MLALVDVLLKLRFKYFLWNFEKKYQKVKIVMNIFMIRCDKVNLQFYNVIKIYVFYIDMFIFLLR